MYRVVATTDGKNIGAMLASPEEPNYLLASGYRFVPTNRREHGGIVTLWNSNYILRCREE